MTRTRYTLILWILCIISPFALIPFERAIAQYLGIEIIVLSAFALVLAGLEAAIIYGGMIFYGLRWADGLGMRFLFLEKEADYKNDFFKPGLIAGVFCAIAILIADACLPGSPLTLLGLARSIPPHIGFFGLFFCIVNQQVFLSLFCIAGIATVLKKMINPISNSTAIMLSILITSVCFGIVHIPLFVRPSMPDIPLVLARIMILNLFSGITFGYVFWKKSFETAIFTHMVVDCILYVVVPLSALL